MLQCIVPSIISQSHAGVTSHTHHIRMPQQHSITTHLRWAALAAPHTGNMAGYLCWPPRLFRKQLDQQRMGRRNGPSSLCWGGTTPRPSWLPTPQAYPLHVKHHSGTHEHGLQVWLWHLSQETHAETLFEVKKSCKEQGPYYIDRA